MADNVAYTPGSGATIAADDIAGILHQRVKLSLGADGIAVDAGAGAGAVGTDTQRVTLASDDPAVAVLGTAADAVATQAAEGTISAKLRLVTAQLAQIQTAVQTLDNAIAGSKMQVDVVGALPAGTNNIGDVDVLSIVPGTSATSLGKAEDAVHATGDTGVMALGVRKDTAAAIAGTDGDYAPLEVDANGRLHVLDQNSAAQLTALQLIDNPVVVDDAAFTPATTSVMMAGFEYDDTTPDSVNEGDAGAARMSANRNQYIQIRDNAGNERGLNVDASGNINVTTVTTVSTVSSVTAIANALPAGTNAIGKLAANSGVDIGDVDITSIVPGTGATNLGKAEDAAHTSGDTGVMALGVTKAVPVSLGADGDYHPFLVDSSGRQWVRQHSVTGAQTIVADNSAAVTILAANASRVGASISNDSSAVLYLLVGAGTASATVYTVRMVQYSYYEVPFGYTGIVQGIWASDPGDGAARVTEWI